MKMSELEKLQPGTLVTAGDRIMWDYESRSEQLVGALKCVWRTSARKAQATIIGPDGKEWYVRDKHVHLADDSQRALFDRVQQSAARAQTECDRIARLLGLENTLVQVGQYITLSWDEAQAIAAKLEAAEAKQ